MAIKYLKTSNIKNQTVLLRPDLNCPIQGGRVTDDFRITQSLPTIKFLLENNNKLIICGHLGRPKGEWKRQFSFRPVAHKLAEFLGLKFVAAHNVIPDSPVPSLIFYFGNLLKENHRKQVTSVSVQDLVFLENMRFYKEEEDNDSLFAKNLAGLADVYVNDAFGVNHHASVSVTGVAAHLPSYCGLLLEKEIKSLDLVTKHHKNPFVLMTAGIKLSEKVGALKNLGKKADKILVGGGVANILFKCKGYEIGLSKIEEGEMKTAFHIAQNFKDKLILPMDVVVADAKISQHSIRVCSPHQVRKNEIILDAGPKTILAFAKEIKLAKTIVWSGPLGLFEKKPFDTATMALCRLIGGRGKGMAYAVAGGGDTVDAIRKSHQFNHIDHVSTGGGAMLEYLSGKKLPGIEALK